MKTTEEVRSEIDRIARLIGADLYPEQGDCKCWNVVPACGEETFSGLRGTRDNGVARILVDAGGYHLLNRDRGVEWEWKVTQNYEELLYLAFEEAVHCVASSYAEHSRIQGQDQRRLTNQMEVDLYALISPACAQRHAAAILKTLERQPYDDDQQARVKCYQELTYQKLSYEDAWLAALKRFPHHSADSAVSAFPAVHGESAFSVNGTGI